MKEGRAWSRDAIAGALGIRALDDEELEDEEWEEDEDWDDDEDEDEDEDDWEEDEEEDEWEPWEEGDDEVGGRKQEGIVWNLLTV